MILCKPDRNPKNALCILIVFALIGISLWIFSLTFPYLKWLFGILFIIAAALTVVILIRFSVTQYVYQLTLTDLIITKTVGARTSTVCSLDLAESKLLISKEAFFEKGFDRNYAYIANRLNCCQNLNTSCYYYVCKIKDETFLIKFEPNEIFVRAMLENIGNAKKNKK